MCVCASVLVSSVVASHLTQSTTDVHDNTDITMTRGRLVCAMNLKRTLHPCSKRVTWLNGRDGTLLPTNLSWKRYKFERFVLAEAAHHVREGRETDQVQRSIEGRLRTQAQKE